MAPLKNKICLIGGKGDVVLESAIYLNNNNQLFKIILNLINLKLYDIPRNPAFCTGSSPNPRPESFFKNFKTLKDIAKAKSEIINNISKHGSLILNKDDKFFNFFSKIAKRRKINVISFSCKKKADIALGNIKKNKSYYILKINVKT